MTGEQLYKYIGDIDDSYIIEAEKAGSVKKRLIFIRLSTVAACLILLFAAMPYARDIISPKGNVTPDDGLQSGDPHDGLIHEDPLFEMNGCYYQIVGDPDTLVNLGLPEVLSDEIAGERVAYLFEDGGEYSLSPLETDIEVFSMKGISSRAAYLVKENGAYRAAVFCNFLISPDASVELGDLFNIYGIRNAEDIKSICEVDWNRGKTVSAAAVTDTGDISRFYSLTTGLISYSNDDFQRETFGSIPEEDQPDAHSSFADDLHVIRIETAEGLYLYIDAHPASGWIYGNGTLSYYRISEELKDWFDTEMSF